MNNKRLDGSKTLLVLLKLRTLIALFALVAVFTILLAERGINFLDPLNLVTISKHVAITAILGLGMTFVIITGGIDLSIGSIVGIAGMIAGGLIREGLVLDVFGITVYFNVGVIIIFVLVIGMIIGAVNGFLVAKLNVPPFIGTLGMMFIARGFANIMSDGATFPDLQGKPELGNTGFTFLGSGEILGLPVSVWLMLLFLVATLYLARKTPLGRHIYAIGGNRRAAQLSGIRVGRVTIFVYIFSGLCAALVGLVISSQLVASHPATGTSYEMNAIAAAVLGGTSLSGGVGTVGGTIVGAFVIGVLSDGLVMLGVSEFWQNVLKGLVIILAVVFDQMNQKVKTKVSTIKAK